MIEIGPVQDDVEDDGKEYPAFLTSSVFQSNSLLDVFHRGERGDGKEGVIRPA
jgi:hypothetical protein